MPCGNIPPSQCQSFASVRASFSPIHLPQWGFKQSATEPALHQFVATRHGCQAHLLQRNVLCTRQQCNAQAAATAVQSIAPDKALRQEGVSSSAAASETGNAQSKANKKVQEGSSQPSASQTCQAESLRLLEWPEVCQQVSSKTAQLAEHADVSASQLKQLANRQ